MDFATLIGLIGALGIISAAILMDSEASAFINVPSMLVVLGGTLAVVLVKFPLRSVLNAMKVATNAFSEKAPEPRGLIERTVELSGVVRKEGLLALESQDVPNEFYRKGLRLCADGLEPHFVRKVLSTDMTLALERHKSGQEIFRAVGETAPAMGMIGTLIGLVQMLTVMEDPSQIGPAMAVALLTTLYGAVIANVIANPIADKLKLRMRQEKLTKSLIIEGINAIQDSRNPRVVAELLQTYLPTKEQGSSRQNQGGAQQLAGNAA
jgi:chemotaxis protein MotA